MNRVVQLPVTWEMHVLYLINKADASLFDSLIRLPSSLHTLAQRINILSVVVFLRFLFHMSLVAMWCCRLLDDGRPPEWLFIPAVPQ